MFPALQMDSGTRIGMVNLQYGYLNRAAFAYYTGIPVDPQESLDDLEQFFREHPRSLVLANGEVAAEFFTGDRAGCGGQIQGTGF